MSILTKICVVILLVLILVACPVFITQATLAPNWRKHYHLEEARANHNLMVARQYQLMAARAQEALTKARQETESLATTKQGEIDRVRDDLSRERVRGANLEIKLASFETQLVELDKSLQKNVEVRKLLTQQLDDSRNTIAKLDKENRRLSDVLRDVQGQVDRLEKVTKVLREQLAARDQRIEELETKLAEAQARGPAVAEGGPPSGIVPVAGGDVRVEGTVTAVRDNLASINIGSANGVRKGMRMIVFRGAQFVSYLQIDDVDVNAAAGVIVDKRLAPLQGDKVANKLQ